MAIVSTGALIDDLRRHQLLRPAQLAELLHLAPGRCHDPRRLAKKLGQRGWLTVYQINQLLAGHGHELVFGPYHILDRLGQGGLSSVYKARHDEQGWIVALKIIKPEVMANADGRAQFLQEMEAMARLDHPNIVQFCDADQAGETYYYAMEYVEGTDLGKYVRLSGPLPGLEACDYVRQTALGLEHAYERNLVHRDIKPVNLYLMGAGRGATVKILDWGLACQRVPTLSSGERGAHPAGKVVDKLTRGVIGTADYLSPEQAKNPHTVDIRGDIYSLGCTCYFLLTGRPPFPHGTLMQKLMLHQKTEPEPVESLCADLPAGLTGVLKRMLAKWPDDRFQTPGAVAAALAPMLKPAATL